MSRILVVEDSPAIALLLRRRLEMAGHEAEVVTNGNQALDRLDAAKVPDLILADVMMPGLDGIETLRRIRKSHPQLPVILVTGQQLEREQELQADAVFAKPIEFDQLLPAIERLA